MKNTLLKLLKWTGRAVLALVVVGGGYGAYVAWLQHNGNFAIVVEGSAYRSNQPTPAAIDTYVKDHGIKSIINLKGAHAGSKWYDDEVKEAAKLGVGHYDFGMSSRQELTPAEAEQLIALMAKVEKPVLIHCDWGADRSGLASALCIAAIAKQGETKAETQLSLRYGHVGIPLSKTYAMDRTWEAMEPYLGFPDS